VVRLSALHSGRLYPLRNIPGTHFCWGLGWRSGSGAALLVGRSRDRFPVVSLYFSLTFISDRTMALGSTQPLVKMSTRNIPRGKGGRCVRLTTSLLSCAECHEIWEPKPPGTLWATPGLLRDSFTLLISVTGSVNLRAKMRPEVLSLWKIPMTPSRIEPVTSRLVA
jgi:hypothetical protein